MSVKTKADEKLQEAKDHLSDAYKALLVVLDQNTWGHSKFKSGFIDEVHEIALEILKINRKL